MSAASAPYVERQLRAVALSGGEGEMAEVAVALREAFEDGIAFATLLRE